MLLLGEMASKTVKQECHPVRQILEQRLFRKQESQKSPQCLFRQELLKQWILPF